MKHSLSILLTLLALSFAVGCGPSVTMTLPTRFVTLAEDSAVQRGEYALRATTPDGVVVGVRSLEHRVDGSLEFWSEAISRRVRDQQGYALVSEDDVTAGTGEAGHLMRFARDLDGHGYRYTIGLFVREDRIFIFEAGGRTAAFEALEEGIEEAVAGMQL